MSEPSLKQWARAERWVGATYDIPERSVRFVAESAWIAGYEAAQRDRRHRDALAAQNERLVKILSAITLCLPPPLVKIDDGRTMQFVDPDPARTLKLLQKSIEQAMAAVDTEGDANAK